MAKKKTFKNKTEKKDVSKMPAKYKKQYPTLRFKSERDIAMDFAEKVFKRFDKLIKSIILFGSTIKNTKTAGSDIDIIIVVDDASVKFTQKLIVWYREELRQLIEQNPYNKDLHINTVKLTTWWKDLSIGDPTVINIIRYGETLIDFGGFFTPQKILLEQGRIKPTPEAIYIALNRVAGHIIRSKQSEMSAIEGCYWAMVDSAQSLLMTTKILPPSPEHIPILLEEHFVSKKLLNKDYITYFKDLHKLHKAIMHGEVRDIDGKIIDDYQNKAQKFYEAVLKLIEQII